MKDKEIKRTPAADLLGVSYQTLYNKYTPIYGLLIKNEESMEDSSYEEEQEDPLV